MNANELADELDDACIEFSGDVWVPTFEQAAAMLRKQQEEIQYWKTAFEKAMEIRTK